MVVKIRISASIYQSLGLVVSRIQYTALATQSMTPNSLASMIGHRFPLPPGVQVLVMECNIVYAIVKDTKGWLKI